MPAVSLLRKKTLAACLFLAGSLVACTTTIRKPLKPELAVSVDSVRTLLGQIVGAENVSVNGEDVTTNGKESKELEIDVFNGQNLPVDGSLLKGVGLNIAKIVRSTLSSKSQFDSYRVVFVKVDSGTVVTKKTWTAFTYKPAEL